jgi:hypothetical protein
LLPRLLSLVREIEPALEVSWDSRDAITVRVPGITRGWAQCRTKESEALICRFIGKKGQFNLSQLDGLGVHPAIDDKRAEADVLRLAFQQIDQVKPAQLKAVLTEHLHGFRELFGKKQG